jgi:hypothetical protein
MFPQLSSIRRRASSPIDRYYYSGNPSSKCRISLAGGLGRYYGGSIEIGAAGIPNTPQSCGSEIDRERRLIEISFILLIQRFIVTTRELFDGCDGLIEPFSGLSL